MMQVFKEFRIELLAGADIDHVDLVVEPGLLEHDEDLPGISRIPEIGVDHCLLSLDSNVLQGRQPQDRKGAVPSGVLVAGAPVPA